LVTTSVITAPSARHHTQLSDTELQDTYLQDTHPQDTNRHATNPNDIDHRQSIGLRRGTPRQLFLLLGLWPEGVLPEANGLTGAALAFLRFLSAFGFFFSLLLRI
jgi:hypothetical protein